MSDEYKWELEPHYSKDYDTYVTNSDSMARQALLEVAEQLWDQMQPGEEKIIKIRMRQDARTEDIVSVREGSKEL